MNVPVKIKRLYKGVRLPIYATPGSAGMDLYCADAWAMLVPPQGRAIVRTGIARLLSAPNGLRLMTLAPRSVVKAGLEAREGEMTYNSPHLRMARFMIAVFGICWVQIAWHFAVGPRLQYMTDLETYNMAFISFGMAVWAALRIFLQVGEKYDRAG